MVVHRGGTTKSEGAPRSVIKEMDREVRIPTISERDNGQTPTE